MSVIDVTNPRWEIDVKPMRDVSTKSFDFVEILETGTYSNIQQTWNSSLPSTLSFEQSNNNSFISLYDSYFLLQFKIVKNTDGSNMAAGDKVALASTVMALFQTCTLQLNGREIERVDDPAIRSILLGLLEYDQDKLVGLGTSEWFYPDLSADPEADANNSSFMARQVRTDAGLITEVRIPLRSIFSFVHDNNTVFIGKRVRIEFIPTASSSNASILYKGQNAAGNAAAPNGQVWIKYMSLFLSTPVATEKITGDIYGYLAQKHQDVKLWSQYNVSHIDGVQGAVGSYQFQLPSRYARVGRVYAMFQRMSRINSQTDNPGVFDHLNMNQAILTMNGVDFPTPPYNLNFTPSATVAPSFQRLFSEFMEAGDDRGRDEGGSIVSLQKFADRYPIFVFDCNYPKDLKIIDQKADLNIRLSFKWNTNNAETMATLGTVGHPTFAAFNGCVSDSLYRLWVVVESHRDATFAGFDGEMVLANLSTY